MTDSTTPGLDIAALVVTRSTRRRWLIPLIMLSGFALGFAALGWIVMLVN